MPAKEVMQRPVTCSSSSLDENYAPVTERFSTNGYDPANINTGISRTNQDPEEEQEEADKIYISLTSQVSPAEHIQRRKTVKQLKF